MSSKNKLPDIVREYITGEGDKVWVIRVTSRARNLGYGWTTQPRRDRAGIMSVDYPSVVGGLRTIEREMDRHARATSGGTWSSSALFIGGRKVRDFIGLVVSDIRVNRETLVIVEADAP